MDQSLDSPNFAFLGEYELLLVRYAGQVEVYLLSEPNTAHQ